MTTPLTPAQDPVDFVIDILERRRQGVVAMDAQAAAVLVPAFMERMAAGARPIYRPVVPYDHSVSKEENLSRAFAKIDAAFAPKRGLIDPQDGEASVASYSVEAGR